jgi:uncharacterized protein (TIGR02646 family)
MRPVRRGHSPLAEDFEDYKDAKPYLVGRLGAFCSYCERPVATMLAVEHIQPKDHPAYHMLVGRWDNFLLACVNCNSAKKAKDVVLDRILLPDRDNTFAAFAYSVDGRVIPAPGLQVGLQSKAKDTLALTGLDKKISLATDENGKMVALDRVSQRMEVWLQAEDAKADAFADPDNVTLRKWIVNCALATGFFSIWITVFADDADMRRRLISAFPGTSDSGCFHAPTGLPVSPAPNPDMLPYGAKT